MGGHRSPVRLLLTQAMHKSPGPFFSHPQPISVCQVSTSNRRRPATLDMCLTAFSIFDRHTATARAESPADTASKNAELSCRFFAAAGSQFTRSTAMKTRSRYVNASNTCDAPRPQSWFASPRLPGRPRFTNSVLTDMSPANVNPAESPGRPTSPYSLNSSSPTFILRIPSLMFSSEAANDMRRYPSPEGPYSLPERSRTPFSASAARTSADCIGSPCRKNA